MDQLFQATGQRADAPDGDADRRRELADFLVSRRDRLPAPQTSGRRRRAKGWLREEVASAAAISVTWYTWLEQGRDIRPSPRVLDGIVRALRLNAVERDYVFRLARPDLYEKTDLGRAEVSPSLAALVQGLMPHPAYVLDIRWDIVVWNEAAEALLGPIDPVDPLSVNLMARLFDEPMRSMLDNWEVVATSALGQYRAGTAALAQDGKHTTLMRLLSDRFPDFVRLWERRDVFAPPNWEKRFRHPVFGPIALRYAMLQPMGDDMAQRLVLYVPVTDADRAALLRR